MNKLREVALVSPKDTRRIVLVGNEQFDLVPSVAPMMVTLWSCVGEELAEVRVLLVVAEAAELELLYIDR